MVIEALGAQVGIADGSKKLEESSSFGNVSQFLDADRFKFEHQTLSYGIVLVISIESLL